MPTLALFAICLWQAAQSKIPTMDDVRRHMHEDIRKVGKATLVYKVHANRVDEHDSSKVTSEVMDVLRWYDGAKYRLESKSDEGQIITEAYDGVASVSIVHLAGIWYESKSNTHFDEKYEAPKTDKIAIGTLNFVFTGPYDFLIAANPDFAVSKFETVGEGKDTFRRVTASTTYQGRDQSLTMDFDPDRWLLRRAELRSVKDPRNFIVLERTGFDKDAKIAPEHFTVDPALHKDMRQLTEEEIKKMGGG